MAVAKSQVVGGHGVDQDVCATEERGVPFFNRFGDLTARGCYTTPEGMRDIGYVGNVAMSSFEEPTPEVLRHVGLG